ncbi:MAG: hypothetical protein JSS07_12360 [Proteobacteria bacterium]|nr:hypothetical protein [Pseudomonadota bacterium]
MKTIVPKDYYLVSGAAGGDILCDIATGAIMGCTLGVSAGLEAVSILRPLAKVPNLLEKATLIGGATGLVVGALTGLATGILLDDNRRTNRQEVNPFG